MTSKQLLAVLGVTLGGLAAAYGLGMPLASGFAFGLAALYARVWKNVAKPIDLLGSMRRGVSGTLGVVWILVLVGLLIPAWTASGTIPFMIETGLKLLDPDHFSSAHFFLPH
ncbi:hypothetical protein [Paenibacillus sp. MBLB4367]|uniref:hypothetical protein n=1 Tax=Paenibacillus sp. MBLB4367 TaxID=3384767 RepID=UPI003907FB3D